MSEPVKFFKTPGDFRKWLENNHLTAKEQWVGFYKKGTKLPSLDVFAKRNPDRSKQGVHEQTQKIELDKEYQKQLEDCGEAWSDFKLRRPSYQKQCIWWILSAKKEETRKKRLKILIDSCKQGQKIPPLRWQK